MFTMGSGNLEKARLIELLYIFKTLNSAGVGRGWGVVASEVGILHFRVVFFSTVYVSMLCYCASALDPTDCFINSDAERLKKRKPPLNTVYRPGLFLDFITTFFKCMDWVAVG